MRYGWLALALLSCLVDETDPRDCRERSVFYPDADGNGLGEPTQVFIGCEPPDGWVTELDPNANGTDPGVDTGAATP